MKENTVFFSKILPLGIVKFCKSERDPDNIFKPLIIMLLILTINSHKFNLI